MELGTPEISVLTTLPRTRFGVERFTQTELAEPPAALLTVREAAITAKTAAAVAAKSGPIEARLVANALFKSAQ
jgi:hypothetical protein